ncbi:hypothetical protein U1Q18_050118 [Sarracenia purpurea var. burkii]
MDIIVYNPQNEGIFPVSSSLVTASTDVILFDGQFSIKDGEKLIEMIEDCGKILIKIIITSGDPDFYFGLQPIIEAYPNVKIVASREVVQHIRKTKDAKMEKWGPVLNEGAPHTLYVPEISRENLFTVEGQSLLLRRSNHYAAYFWIPTMSTILGGISVSWGIHVFTADTQTPESRESWCDVLREIIDLKPQQVVPGHYLGERPAGDEAVRFTLDYLLNFEKVLREHEYKNSKAVIDAMKTAYPYLGMVMTLEISAKVNTGEMEW